jgi:hypothetical protein
VRIDVLKEGQNGHGADPVPDWEKLFHVHVRDSISVLAQPGEGSLVLSTSRAESDPAQSERN